MSAPQFTPGPWRIGTGGVSKQIPVLSDDDDGTIVVCELDGFTCDVSADASLIAAAPELYEALDHFCNRYLVDEHEDAALCWDADHHRAVKALFYALAKARGEQP